MMVSQLLVLCCGALLMQLAIMGGAARYIANGTLDFVAVGDWGGQTDSPYTTQGEESVAEQMGKTAAQVGSQFTLALGDNFYENGVKDADDPRFKETFESVFTSDSLQSRWYVVCGNHDWLGNASAQVAYTARSSRWYMPDFYYTETMTIPGTNSTVQFVLIDTIILAGTTDPVDRFLPPKGPVSMTQANKQWAWINETLQNSKADWIIVAGHYPVWSVSHHGPTQVLVDQLRPMLMANNVSAYFSGHDHNMQYIQESASPVSYFVTGAGRLTDPSMKHKDDVPSGSLKFFHGHDDPDEKKGGYTTVSITPSIMNVTFYSHKGNVQYSTTRPRIR